MAPEFIRVPLDLRDPDVRFLHQGFQNVKVLVTGQLGLCLSRPMPETKIKMGDAG